MTELLVCTVLTGCWTAWAVVLMRKWGVSEWLQVHGTRLVSEWAGCDYCKNFWLSWPVALVLVAVTGHWWLLLVPFGSTMIGRWLSA